MKTRYMNDTERSILWNIYGQVVHGLIETEDREKNQKIYWLISRLFRTSNKKAFELGYLRGKAECEIEIKKEFKKIILKTIKDL